ncbi:MAG: hypothetical protein KF901_14145 [Myxococcales bacterium]|nr:hypothetical protein [Myxococcales bacterium]
MGVPLVRKPARDDDTPDDDERLEEEESDDDDESDEDDEERLEDDELEDDELEDDESPRTAPPTRPSCASTPPDAARDPASPRATRATRLPAPLPLRAMPQSTPQSLGSSVDDGKDS